MTAAPDLAHIYDLIKLASPEAYYEGWHAIGMDDTHDIEHHSWFGYDIHAAKFAALVS